MAGIKTPKVISPKIKVYTTNHQERIEPAALQHEDKNALMVLVDLYTGLRIGELCGLYWSDFQWDSDFFDISRILERLYKKWTQNRPEYQLVSLNRSRINSSTALYVGPPKTESGKRRIYLSEQAITSFHEIEAQQKKLGLYHPDGFVFLQANGNPYEPRGYYKLYRDILSRADVSYHNFHSLRHTFATRAFELHFDIPTLAEILGHAQKSTTENMYGHSLDETKKRNMEKFNLHTRQAV